jgi:streptogramin lyase
MMNVTTSFKTFLFPIIGLIFYLSINASGQNFEIYVSDAGNFSNPPWKIFKYDENGENPEVFIDTVLAWPQDIVFLEDQQVVLISNLNSGRITKYNSSTGDYIGNFATGIAGPTRMKIGADSLLYVLQWSGNGKVRRYQLDGTYVGEFTNLGVAQSIGLDWDSNGNLFVSSYSGDNVRKFDPNGNDLGVIVASNLAGPTNIWIDENDNLFVLDYDGTAVKKFNSNGAFQNNFINGLSQSEGVDFFSNGNILIGNGATSSVKLFDSNGVYIKEFIPSGSGGLLRPNAVVIREVAPVNVQEESSINTPEFKLDQNYPNPFNPSTKIGWQSSVSGRQTLKVYDVLGNEVATLVDEYRNAGFNSVLYTVNSSLPSGVYYYHLRAGSFIQTNKMIYLK